MRIIAQFKTDAEKKAFMIGVAFYLGYIAYLKKKLTFDANDPHWVTGKKKHHKYKIDDEGIIQSGKLKGQPIDSVSETWEKINNRNRTEFSKPKLSNSEAKSRRKYVNKFKYDQNTPEKAWEYLDSITLTPRTEADLIQKRFEFNKSLDNVINKQPESVKQAINNFKLNPNGVTEIPYISPKIRELLNMDPNRKIVFTLFQQKRALGRHDDMDAEGLRKGLALCLMGNNLDIIRLKANSPNYSHLAIRIHDRVFGDVIIDFAKKNRFYEVIHFHKNSEKEVNKKKIK